MCVYVKEMEKERQTRRKTGEGSPGSTIVLQDNIGS